MSYDSYEDTTKHIKRVRENIDELALRIVERKEGHDKSKLESPEKEVFDEVTPLLKSLTYGSDEYKETLDRMKVALDHHYAKNRHHPEHFKGTSIIQGGEKVGSWNAGMKGMTLVDLIEMFCDWCAATERHEDGDIGKSIRINMERFGYGETLACILSNTANQYQMGKNSHRAI